MQKLKNINHIWALSWFVLFFASSGILSLFEDPTLQIFGLPAIWGFSILIQLPIMVWMFYGMLYVPFLGGKRNNETNDE